MTASIQPDRVFHMTYTDDDYWTSVSSAPEKFGLTFVGSLPDPWASYSFNDLCVWSHEDGRVFWATDSGCSCPSPFEDFKSLDDLTEVTRATWAEFQTAVTDHCAKDYGDDENTPDPQAADKTQLLAKVSGLLR